MTPFLNWFLLAAALSQLLLGSSLFLRSLHWRYPALLFWSFLLGSQNWIAWVVSPSSVKYMQVWLWTCPLWCVMIALVIREAFLRTLEDYPRQKGFITFLVLVAALMGMIGAAVSVSSEWANLATWSRMEVWVRLAFVGTRYLLLTYAVIVAIPVAFFASFARAAARTPNSSRNIRILLAFLAFSSLVSLVRNLLSQPAQPWISSANNAVTTAIFLVWTLALTQAGERRPELGKATTAMQEAKRELEEVIRLGSRLWDRRFRGD